MTSKDFIFMNNPTAETEQVKVIPEEFSFIEKLNALIKYVNSLPIKPESEVIERLENVEKIMSGYDNRLTNVETGLQAVNTDIDDVNTNLTTTNNLVNTNVKDIEQIKQHATQTDSNIEDIMVDISDIQQTDIYIVEKVAENLLTNSIVTLPKNIDEYEYFSFDGYGNRNIRLFTTDGIIFGGVCLSPVPPNTANTATRVNGWHVLFEKTGNKTLKLFNTTSFGTCVDTSQGIGKTTDSGILVKWGDGNSNISLYPNSIIDALWGHRKPDFKKI